MHDTIATLRDNIRRVYLGDDHPVDQLVCCLIAGGHVLIEDVPGVGKTVLASALARSVDCGFKRLQLTPDMLPADVIGVSVYDRENGRFDFHPGPVFTNIMLADEINRTTPRTQSALLEAMAEGNVSIDGVTHPLPAPFMVVATQNPYEFADTYPLPENQLDRFLMRFRVGYPTPEAESRMLDIRPGSTVLNELAPVIHADDVLALQRAATEVHVSQAIRDYVVAIARATRDHEAVRVGVSPRGTLALTQAARATALMDGRDHVIPEDILDNLHAVCAHRLVTSAYALDEGAEHAAEVLDRVVEQVPTPA